jgi:large-conductance mechanosensitive channel
MASQVAPGALGFLVVAAMALALFFLIRSMNKQLRKVDAGQRSFAQQAESPAEESKTGPRQDS